MNEKRVGLNLEGTIDASFRRREEKRFQAKKTTEWLEQSWVHSRCLINVIERQKITCAFAVGERKMRV